MTTTQILVGIGLATFYVFGSLVILYFDEIRRDVRFIQINTTLIAEDAEGLRRDRMIDNTQPEKATPAVEDTRNHTVREAWEEYEWIRKNFIERDDSEVEDVSHYSEQSVDPQAARDALEQAWREFYRRYGGHGYPLHAASKKASPEQSWPEEDEAEVPLGDQYPDGTKLSDMLADREAQRVADQPAAQLAHCSCIWDIVWTPQTMARPGDKMERREGIAQYDRNCPVHGHNSPGNRREDAGKG